MLVIILVLTMIKLLRVDDIMIVIENSISTKKPE